MDTSNVIRLDRRPGGVGAGIRSSFDRGRFEIASAGPNPEFAFIGSDPWGTDAYTGLVVPPTPSSAIGGARYLFLLARARFGVGEDGPRRKGVRLIGIRQYVELIARLPGRQAPLAANAGPPTGSTVVFRKEIESPLWHPPDGDISWHVMVIPRTYRSTRNPANTDGFIFQDAMTPSLLYQTAAPYSPPNGGRPWGRPIAASLGNIHELRYRWRANNAEYMLDIPVPVPTDVALFASVRQSDPALNPVFADLVASSQQIAALSEEDRFLTSYATSAQYGVIAGSLVFEENLEEDTP